MRFWTCFWRVRDLFLRVLEWYFGGWEHLFEYGNSVFGGLKHLWGYPESDYGGLECTHEQIEVRTESKNIATVNVCNSEAVTLICINCLGGHFW